MKKFKYTDDIVKWLEPMGYQSFWYAVEPYNLVLQSRGHCDQQIADGVVDQETVPDVLKYMTRMELAKIQGLHWRPVTPWLKVVQ